MKTSRKFIECLDCNELFFIIERENRLTLQQTEPYRVLVFHAGLPCPECGGTLIVESFEQMTWLLKDRETTISQLKLLQRDFEDKIASLQAEKERLQEVNRNLQEQLDEARQSPMPEQHQPVCRQCGKPLTHDKKGRFPDYCSNSCKQKAYRVRKQRYEQDEYSNKNVTSDTIN